MLRRILPVLLLVASLSLVTAAFALPPTQPPLGTRVRPLLRFEGLEFRDLNGNGVLDPYEDWRLSPELRAADLVNRLSLAEQAGLMLHAILPEVGEYGAYRDHDDDALGVLVLDRQVHYLLTALGGDPQTVAHANNRAQEMAERSEHGIPLLISSDPRHGFHDGVMATASGVSRWPDPLGFGAIGDADRVRRYCDVVRSEYRALGITALLGPQADLATEPRWSRSVGTFGSQPGPVSALAGACVEGLQGAPNGLARNGVLAVVKHYAGYGAEVDGIDAHGYAGRHARLAGNSLNLHLDAFRGALRAQAGGIMPAYPILGEAHLRGQPLEAVAPGFNRSLLQGYLRDYLGYRGLIVSDWQIIDDCNDDCRAAGVPQFPRGLSFNQLRHSGLIGKPWGLEEATPYERVVRALQAGIDQFGGIDESDLILKAVEENRVSADRIRESAQRALVPLFALGLFENPYVDEQAAGRTVATPALRAEGAAAQRDAMVLLENPRALLPLPTGRKVWAYGVSAVALRAAGLEPVAELKDADVAVVRAAAPEDRLLFGRGNAAFDAFTQASYHVPVILVMDLSRPVILSEVQARTPAILGEFGADDAAVADVLSGRAPPHGRLPFELPSSEAAVAAQDPALPDDSAAPLYPRGTGLSFARESR